MKVEDFFKVGELTIFSGVLNTGEKYIADTQCVIEVRDNVIGKVKIEGEVLNGAGSRDLWTSTQIDLDRSILQQGEIWLVSE